MKRSADNRKEKRTTKTLLPLIPYLYRIGNAALGLTRLPVMGKAGHKLLDTEHSNVTYIPIDADLEIPETTVAPVTIVEHFIRNRAIVFRWPIAPAEPQTTARTFPRMSDVSGWGLRQRPWISPRR